MCVQELDEASRRGPPPLDPFAEKEVDPVAEVEELESSDPLRGKRVHAWVLVTPGKRDIAVSRWGAVGVRSQTSYLPCLHMRPVWLLRRDRYICVAVCVCVCSCWQDPFFIEPSTGRVYPVYEAPYLGVEAAWNHRNYWVNMTPQCPVRALSYDLTNSDLWEYVFIDPFNMPPKAPAGADPSQVSRVHACLLFPMSSFYEIKDV
jgi:hypothetical protein